MLGRMNRGGWRLADDCYIFDTRYSGKGYEIFRMGVLSSV